MGYHNFLTYMRVLLYPQLKLSRIASGDLNWKLRVGRTAAIIVALLFGILRLDQFLVQHPSYPLDLVFLLSYAIFSLGTAFRVARQKLFYDPYLSIYILAPVSYRHLVLSKFFEVLLIQLNIKQAFPLYLFFGIRLMHPLSTFFKDLVIMALVPVLQSAFGTLGTLLAVSINSLMGQIVANLFPVATLAITGLIIGYAFILQTPVPLAPWIIVAELFLIFLALFVIWHWAGKTYGKGLIAVGLQAGGLKKEISRGKWRFLSFLLARFPINIRVVAVKDWRMLEGNVFTWVRLFIWGIMSLLPLLQPVQSRLNYLGNPRAVTVWAFVIWLLCFSELIATAFSLERAKYKLYRNSPIRWGEFVHAKIISNLFPYELGILITVLSTSLILRYELSQLMVALITSLTITSALTFWILGICSFFFEGNDDDDMNIDTNSTLEQAFEQAILSIPSLMALLTGLLLGIGALVYLFSNGQVTIGFWGGSVGVGILGYFLLMEKGLRIRRGEKQ